MDLDTEGKTVLPPQFLEPEHPTRNCEVKLPLNTPPCLLAEQIHTLHCQGLS